MVLELALIAALAAAPSTDAGFFPACEVIGAKLHLGEALDLSDLPPGLRSRASGLVVAALRPDQDWARFSKTRLLAQAQAQMPVLGAWSPQERGGHVILRRAADAESSVQSTQSSCWRVVQAFSVGQVIPAGAVEPSDCPEQVEVLISYDTRIGAPRARRELSAGQITAGPQASAFPTIGPGQRVRLGVRVGPVRVEREVEALQSARPGQAFFARADDGSVFSSAGLEAAP